MTIKNISKTLFLILATLFIVETVAFGQQKKSVRQLRAEANRLIKEGESDVRSGENLLAKRQSSIVKIDLAKVHRQGQELVDRGNAMIAKGKKILADIEAERQAKIVRSYEAEVAMLPWSDALDNAAAGLLAAIDEKDYRSFLYKTYIKKRGKYMSPEKLDNAVVEAVLKAPANHAVNPCSSITLTVDHAKKETRFMFPDFDPYTSPRKFAVIFGELVVLPSVGEALIHLRAVDIKTFEIIASSMARTSVGEEVAAVLEVKAPEPRETLEWPGGIHLDDPTGIIYRGVNAAKKMVFNIMSGELPKEDPATVYMLAYTRHLLSSTTDLAISDAEFISKNLKFAKEDGKVYQLDSLKASFILSYTPPPEESLNQQGSFELSAKRGKEPIPVGAIALINPKPKEEEGEGEE